MNALHSEELIRHLETRGGDAKSFSTAINQLVKEGRLDLAEKALSIMHAKYVPANGYTYPQLITAFGKSGNIDKCLHLFKMSERDKVEPSQVLYNSIIVALIDNSRIDEAISIYKQMRSVHHLSVTTMTTNRLLSNCCKMGQVDIAEDLLRDSQGVLFDTISYNTIIQTWCKKGEPYRAEQIYRQMLAHGVNPDSLTYSSLITAWTKRGEHRYAQGLEAEMNARGIVLTQQQQQIGFAAQARSVVTDKDVYRRELTGSAPLLTRESCHTLLRTHARQGDAVAVEKGLSEMTSSGIQPDADTYGVILDGLCRSKLLDDAWRYFETARKSSATRSTFVYNSFISGLIKAGQPHRAWSVFEMMEKDRIRADIITLSAVVRAAVACGRGQEGVALIPSLSQRTQCEPDVSTWDSLLSSLYDANLKDVAQDVQYYRKQLSVPLTEFSYLTLFKYAVNPQQVSLLLCECDRASIPLSAAIYRSAIENTSLPDGVALYVKACQKGHFEPPTLDKPLFVDFHSMSVRVALARFVVQLDVIAQLQDDKALNGIQFELVVGKGLHREKNTSGPETSVKATIIDVLQRHLFNTKETFVSEKNAGLIVIPVSKLLPVLKLWSNKRVALLRDAKFNAK